MVTVIVTHLGLTCEKQERWLASKDLAGDWTFDCVLVRKLSYQLTESLGPNRILVYLYGYK